MSEAFDALLKIYGREAERHRADQTEYGLACARMIGKPLAVEQLLNSLSFLGQREAVEFIVERYDLGPARERLLERSKRRKAIALASE